MTLNYENESQEDLGIDCEQIALRVIEQTLDVLGCPYEVQVNLLVTDSEQIREMNRRYRQIDSPTDVLSFPMLDMPGEGDFSFLENDEYVYDCFDPETGELLMGDIVINAQRVLSQAADYGHSVTREFAFLIAHSMLHLSGFDHMEDDERIRMERKQEEILENLGITRESGKRYS